MSTTQFNHPPFLDKPSGKAERGGKRGASLTSPLGRLGGAVGSGGAACLIATELATAGIDKEQLALEQEIRGMLITPETEIEEPDFLFSQHGVKCFPRGELIGIQGKKKSGKTFFCSILIALCLRREVMGMQRIRPTGLRVLWLDTEQSRHTTKRILCDRIRRMIDAETMPMDGVAVVNLRAKTWDTRMRYAEQAIAMYKPDLVVFDGIRDCIDDINDHSLSAALIERLTQIASGRKRGPDELPTALEWPECCIAAVLHENKAAEDNTLRGAIGTELGNKSYEVYQCKHDKQMELFSVEQCDSRDAPWTHRVEFRVDDTGLPRMLSDQERAEMAADDMLETKPKPRPSGIQLRSRWGYNPDYCKSDGQLDYALLFREILHDGREIAATDLMNEFMQKSFVTSHLEYSDIRHKAESERIICKRRKGKYVVYSTVDYHDKNDLFFDNDNVTPF